MPKHASYLERLFEKCVPEPNSGCWLWDGAGGDYGAMLFQGRMTGAHRVSYILHNGEIADDLVIDHRCRVSCCINPAHLDVVTQAENVRRSLPYNRQLAKTHCIYGHLFDERNTWINKRGHRYCRKCKARRSLAFQKRR